MRKIKIISSLVLFATIVLTSCKTAQVTSALSMKESGDIKKAVTTINEAIDPSNEKSEKVINWPNTWEARGEIYQAVYQSKDPEVKKLSDAPLKEAYDSYKKALELDTKGKLDKSIKIKLTLLVNDLANQAVEAFNDNNYEKAEQSFEEILNINNMDVMKADNPDFVDTVYIFNAGLAAYRAENYDKAIKYFKDAAKYDYNGARTYSLIADSYQQKKDTLSALQTLKDGFEKYPKDNTILTNMIQIYLNLNKTEDALKYLDVAIKQDPDNSSYYFAQGTLYEKLNMEDKAIEAYQNAIDADNTFFNAYYNLGALYYNKGVQQIDVANSVPAGNNEKYMEEIKKADKWWEKALPYMEKCHELKPDDRMTLESLKNLYYRTKQMDKYNAILKQLGQNQ
ncbi:MAG: tetratricopeptide repeat protein [Prolixibacteraceae bacterium]|nr:tetratricopeptide repeat protein [Prolixibacteraceae bacterium]